LKDKILIRIGAETAKHETLTKKCVSQMQPA
jgi:hypothetical protein